MRARRGGWRLRVALTAVALSFGGTAAGSAPELQVIANGCGPGTTLLLGAARSCVHSAVDSVDVRAQAQWVGKAPVTSPPVCYGDGQTGPRVQLIYGYVSGQKNRATTVLPLIRNGFAPRMQAMVKAASAGRDLGIRFTFNKGCAGLSVPVVAFPASVVATGDANKQFDGMIARLQQLGFDRADRKYQVIWDRWNSGGICGLGELAPTLDQPAKANLHDGVPTVGHTDVPSTVGVSSPGPRYSAVWKLAFGPKGVDCWEVGQSKAAVQVHELLHTLGAVQLSAPHSDGGGHCTDTPSVMCMGGSGVPYSEPRCGIQKVQVLDCGNDDYWSPAPAQGSYLATHDNLADSSYVGPEPQDQLAAAPL